MKRQTLVAWAALLLALSSLMTTVIFHITSSNNALAVGYVESNIVFQKFKGTIELDTQLKQLKNKHAAILDSLRLALTKAELSKDNEATVRVSKQLGNVVALFEEEQNAKSQEYSEAVWTQINQYVKDYGALKGYTYILGANGNGSLMYAKEAENITTTVIDYINQRYEGHP